MFLSLALMVIAILVNNKAILKVKHIDRLETEKKLLPLFSNHFKNKRNITVLNKHFEGKHIILISYTEIFYIVLNLFFRINPPNNKNSLNLFTNT